MAADDLKLTSCKGKMLAINVVQCRREKWMEWGKLIDRLTGQMCVGKLQVLLVKRELKVDKLSDEIMTAENV